LPSHPRDVLLDMAKGLAIVLVVLGHTLQTAAERFDEVAAFRVIYSFHMPLFAFLAGAAAAHWLARIDAETSALSRARMAGDRIRRAAVHLLLPFFAWTLCNWVLGHPADASVPAYLRDVMLQPDLSLWFLPCMFWCTVYAAVFALVATPLTRLLQLPLRARLRPLALAAIRSGVFLALWGEAAPLLPPGYGLAFANAFHGGLFLFFALGACFFAPLARWPGGILRLLPCLVFVLLVPYWQRMAPTHLAPSAPAFLHWAPFEDRYALLVALTGTFAAVELTRLLARGGRFVRSALAYLGQASLAIYAVHFYFLGLSPRFVAPLVLSVVFYFVAVRIPGLRLLLLGAAAGPKPARVPAAAPAS
jgi:fucose 4-O-acetylase-like acetyltransferase